MAADPGLLSGMLSAFFFLIMVRAILPLKLRMNNFNSPFEDDDTWADVATIIPVSLSEPGKSAKINRIYPPVDDTAPWFKVLLPQVPQ